MNRLIGIIEAAQILGVTAQTLRRWDYSGKLKSIRIGVAGHRRYSMEALERFMKGKK